MTDIARVGFSADTQALDDAKAKLDALVPSAQRAEKAAGGVGVGLAKANAAFKAAASGAASANNAMNNAANGATNNANKVNQAATANRNYASSTAGVAAGANSSASALNRLGAAANDNINRLQSTPGNIAAQFQDIGVTAAGGMSPMLIALQQGTQLSSAMAGGIGNLFAGIKQLFNATTLLTIGLVGVIAAFIQWVDWIEVARTALYALADIIEASAPYLVTFAAAMALIYSPAIIAGIFALTKAFVGLAASIALSLGIPALVIAGFLAIIAAANIWRDDLTKMLGYDIVGAAKTGVNYIIDFFVLGFNAIKSVWSKLPAAIGDVAIQAANNTIQAIELMINGAIARINLLTSMLPFGAGEGLKMENIGLGRMGNPFAGAASGVGQAVRAETFGKAGQTDYLGAGIKAVQGLASDAAGMLRDLADGLGADGKKDKVKKAARGRKEREKKPEKTQDELFDEVLDDAYKQMRALQQAGKQIGLYGEELAQLKYQQELFNAAQDKGVVIVDKATGKLNKYGLQLLEISKALAKVSEENRKLQFMEDMAVQAERDQRALDRQRAEIGLTGAALASYRYEQELLEQARRANIDLTPAEIAAIKQSADAYGQQTETIKKMKEQLEFSRDTLKGFFSDFIDGVRDGMNIFEAFRQSLINALDRILDHLINNFLDVIVNQLLPGPNAAAGGGGGILGSIFSLFGLGGGFGGGVKGFAQGGIFGSGGSLISSPMLFGFGGKIGQAGERGPEAIMPLQRGSDGALGVRVSSGRKEGNTVRLSVSVVNNHTITGAVSSRDIIEMNRQSAQNTKDELKRQIPAIISEFQRDGTIVT